MSCQICRIAKLLAVRDLHDVGIIKRNRNPTTDPNPKTLTLIITLTITEEINIK